MATCLPTAALPCVDPCRQGRIPLFTVALGGHNRSAVDIEPRYFVCVGVCVWVQGLV